MKKTLFREERLRLIMEIISEQNSVIVNDLAEKFGKSPGSIRLDLAELENRGLISRTHGGAILIDGSAEDLVLNKKLLQLRVETRKEEKQRIGKAVVDLVHDGDSIMIDGGTTTYFVAKNLHTKRDLTIITTSVHLFPVLWEIPDATIYLTGGVVHRGFEDTYGEIALESISKFKPDLTIIGIDGVSVEHGITATEPTVAMLKRSMIAVSKNLVVVADSSKFGKVCLLSIAGIKDVSTIVTDTDLSEEDAEAFSELGTAVIRA
jgi:DeoR family transcriptional regulator, fructose operon transcriptional repressor